ncbi:MAG: hypothetical protein ACFE8L_10685 [Candidatus Hodarchaeota archaeon]
MKIGKKLRKIAEKNNLLNFPKTVLYAGANKVRHSLDLIMDTYIPDTIDAIWKFLRSVDGSTEMGKSKPSRKKQIYYLAPEIWVFVEVDARVAGFNAMKGSNHILKINIYSDNNEYIKGIAHAINDNFASGVLNQINWEKVDKIFHIDKEKEIAAWKLILEMS